MTRARELLARRLRERYPGLQIVGGASPPFRPLSLEEDERLLADIESSGAQVVWVGTGQPRQEQWMHRMRPRLRAPLLVGVGAAFDFHAGLVKQAPRWMMRSGLEWSYRLMREPRRLWRRYARYNPRFVVAFARQYARERRGPVPPRDPHEREGAGRADRVPAMTDQAIGVHHRHHGPGRVLSGRAAARQGL